MDMQAILADGLSKTYRTRVKEAGLKASVQALVRPQYREMQAVKRVGFQVERGEMLAFIGPNGAGKSTTIKMMTGILTPTSGSVRVMGFDPTRERQKLSYHIGTVFGQKSQLWFHLPPSDSFQLLGAIYDIPDDELKKRTDDLVDRFALAEFLKTPVRKLSLGQRIRCEVAASLLHRPEILLLDEPTIGLDVVVKRQIRELIVEMNRQYGTTVFLTSHDAGDVERLCKRAMIIDRGELIIDRPVKALKHEYFRSKVISARFDAAVKLNPPDGIRLIKQSSDGLGVSLSVDTVRISMDDTMRWLVSEGLIMDVTVEDPQMEQIIADIFSRGEAG